MTRPYHVPLVGNIGTSVQFSTTARYRGRSIGGSGSCAPAAGTDHTSNWPTRASVSASSMEHQGPALCRLRPLWRQTSGPSILEVASPWRSAAALGRYRASGDRANRAYAKPVTTTMRCHSSDGRRLRSVMFTVRLAGGVCLGYGSAVARAATARQVIEFAAAFAPGRCGVIVSTWFELQGRYVVEVYDWCACWCSGPVPVLAVVIAPPGFRPPDSLSRR
jgi:hypothetical protein